MRHVAKQTSKRLKKEISSIPAGAMDALSGAAWTRNIRELDSVVARAMILSQDKALPFPSGELALAA